MNKALFLDRDGILNKVVVREGVVSSPRSLDEFELLEDAAALVEGARKAGFFIAVVTNQPDVDRGLLNPGVLDQMHERLRHELGIDCIEVCPSSNDSDRRRKPNPGMLTDVARSKDIDLKHSVFVGDGRNDLLAGQAAGVTTILLKTDYNSPIHNLATHAVDSLHDIIGYLQGAKEKQ